MIIDQMSRYYLALNTSQRAARRVAIYAWPAGDGFPARSGRNGVPRGPSWAAELARRARLRFRRP